MNEFCYICEWHTWMGHVTHMTGSCHTCEWVRYRSVSVHVSRQLRRSLFLHSLRSLSRFFFGQTNLFCQNKTEAYTIVKKKNNKLVVCTRKQIYWICLQKFVGLCSCIRCEVYPGFLFWKKNRGLHNCVNKPMNLLCVQENRSIGHFYKNLWVSVRAFAAKSIQVFFFGKKNRGLHNCVKKPINLLCVQENRSIGCFYKNL